MLVTHITVGRREEWNAFAAQQLSFGLLQSWDWGEFKARLGWKAYRIAAEEQGKIVAGAQLLIKPVLRELFSLAYIPRGPIGNWLDEETAPQVLSELHRVARQHKAILLRIEPPLLHDPGTYQVLVQLDFRARSYTNQPRATLVVDLSPDLDDVFGQLPRKTRYNIRYAAKKGVAIRSGSHDDLPAFFGLMQITGQRGGFSPRTYDYYEHEWQVFGENGKAALLMAFYQDQLLAVRMVFCFGEHAADIHAASSREHSHLRPNHLLAWEAIKWAKAQGCHTYDFWGIPDEVGQAIYEGRDLPKPDRTDGLWGAYQFKRSFSENVMFYVSAHDFIYSPRLYSFFFKKLINADTLDRFAVWMDSLRPSQES